MAKGIKYYITSGFDNRGSVAAQKSVLALGKSFLKATVGIGTATAAISKMNAVLKESVQAALADEKAQTALNKVLENSGFGSAATQVAAYIDQAQMATGVTEDQLRPAFTQLFNALGSVTKAQKTLNIAMDVSAATGRDLSSVTAAIAKAAAGSNTAISRLGLGIQKADLAAMSFDEILATLEQKFSGSTAVAAETMAGKMDRLRIATAEAKEEIGKGLLDALTNLSGQGGGSIDQLQTKIVNIGVGIGNIFRGLTAGVDQLNNAWNQTQLGKFLNGIAALSGTSAGGFLLESSPFGPVIKGMKAVMRLGEEQRRKDMIGKGGGYYAQQVTAQAEKQAKLTTVKLAAEKKVTAEKKKQLDITKRSAKFDQELIQIAAAKTRNVSAENRMRLMELEAIRLAELGLKTVPATAAAMQVGGITGPNAGTFRLAEQGANLGLGYSGQPLTPLSPAGTPTGGVVNNTININALSTMDVQEAVAAAVNNGSRAGLAYTQVFSRL